MQIPGHRIRSKSVIKQRELIRKTACVRKSFLIFNIAEKKGFILSHSFRYADNDYTQDWYVNQWWKLSVLERSPLSFCNDIIINNYIRTIRCPVICTDISPRTVEFHRDMPVTNLCLN